VIEIGSHRVGDETVPIESLKTVVAKIESIYVPSALTRMSDGATDQSNFYGFKIVKFDEGQIVKITSEGGREEALAQTVLHEHVTAPFLQDHHRVTNIASQGIALIVETAERDIVHLEAKARVAVEQEKILGTAIFAAKTQLRDTIKRIAQLEGRLSAMLGELDAAETISALLLSQQIEVLVNRKLELDEKIDVSFPIARSDVQAQLVSAVQKKEIALRTIEHQETLRENIRTTRVLGERAVMSATSVTPKKTIVILISLIVGVAIAIGSALAMDFLSRAQRRGRS
jgi:hypothetical protein